MVPETLSSNSSLAVADGAGGTSGSVNNVVATVASLVPRNCVPGRGEPRYETVTSMGVPLAAPKGGAAALTTNDVAVPTYTSEVGALATEAMSWYSRSDCCSCLPLGNTHAKDHSNATLVAVRTVAWQCDTTPYHTTQRYYMVSKNVSCLPMVCYCRTGTSSRAKLTVGDAIEEEARTCVSA